MNEAEFESELRAEGYDPQTRTMEPNQVNAAHAHGFDARLLILEGAMTIVCDGETRTYGPGESFTMTSGRVHEERIGPEGVRYVAGRRAAAR